MQVSQVSPVSPTAQSYEVQGQLHIFPHAIAPTTALARVQHFRPDAKHPGLFRHCLDKVRPSSCKIAATWNVEGLLTESKLEQLIQHMLTHSIDLLCLQETHQQGSEYYVSGGFLVINSGNDNDVREPAGVGFIVAPGLRHAVMGFMQFSQRLASITLRVKGGSLRFISAYAPHNGHDLSVRADFFSELASFIRRQRPHRPTFVFGDLNARIFCSQTGEEAIIGQHIFRDPQAVAKPHNNRDLLCELCFSNGLVLANSFFERPTDETVTYFGLTSKPMDAISVDGFAELDHILAQLFGWTKSFLSVLQGKRLCNHTISLYLLNYWCRFLKPKSRNPQPH